MKLLAYKIENKVVNRDVFNWTSEQLNGNNPWMVSQSDAINYEDISSIENWDKFSNQIDKDFLFIRNEIKILVDEYTYPGKDNDVIHNCLRLSREELIIASKYFLIPKEIRDIYQSEQEQQFWWKNLINKSQESRNKRWSAAKTWISYNLSTTDSSDLAKSTTELCNDYINYNIISKSKDGVSGLFDYLRGIEDYSLNGFPSKSYWTQNYQDKLLDILENGNY